jgi:hypothetical protein
MAISNVRLVTQAFATTSFTTASTLPRTVTAIGVGGRCCSTCRGMTIPPPMSRSSEASTKLPKGSCHRAHAGADSEHPPRPGVHHAVLNCQRLLSHPRFKQMPRVRKGAGDGRIPGRVSKQSLSRISRPHAHFHAGHNCGLQRTAGAQVRGKRTTASARRR